MRHVTWLVIALTFMLATIVHGNGYLEADLYSLQDCRGAPQKVAMVTETCLHWGTAKPRLLFTCKNTTTVSAAANYVGGSDCSGGHKTLTLTAGTCHPLGNAYIKVTSCTQSGALPTLSGGMCSNTYSEKGCTGKPLISQCMPTSCTALNSGVYSKIDCSAGHVELYTTNDCAGSFVGTTFELGTCPSEDTKIISCSGACPIHSVAFLISTAVVVLLTTF